MKPHCSRCKEIIDRVRDALNELDGDAVKVLAAHLELSCIVSEEFEPIPGTRRWRKNGEPAEVFSPGSYLAEELEERDWTREHLSRLMEVSPDVVTDLIEGRATITPDLAARISKALNTSAELWLNLEASWQARNVAPAAPAAAAEAAQGRGT